MTFCCLGDEGTPQQENRSKSNAVSSTYQCAPRIELVFLSSMKSQSPVQIALGSTIFEHTKLMKMSADAFVSEKIYARGP